MMNFDSTEHELIGLTHSYFRELTGMWRSMFDENLCEEHLNKLKLYVKSFYDDLVKESLEKRKFIETNIKDLQEEAEMLRRLLNVDVPLLNVKELPLVVVHFQMDKSLVELRQKLHERREQICELLLQQETLCVELGEPPRPLLADPLPTIHDIDEFRKHLEQLQSLRVQRKCHLTTIRREIKYYLKVLEIRPRTDTEDQLLNERQLQLSVENFEALQKMKICYGEQVQELHSAINAMREKLTVLWERLQEGENVHAHIYKTESYTQKTYDILNAEVQRCESLIRQNIKKLVEKLREEITVLWERTLKSEAERKRFPNFYSDCFTEDLLILHEMHLDDLKLFYDSNKEIFDLYEDRKVLWARMSALEARANDPSRFNNRGGKLLAEERERKTIATKLPKIEQKIRELVIKFEEREFTPFTVYGENILELMKTEWKQKRHEKEQLSSARKNYVATPKTKMLPPRTPLSLKNISTTSIVSSMRKAPSVQNLNGNRPSMKTTLNYGAYSTGVKKRKLSAKEFNHPHAKRSLISELSESTKTPTKLKSFKTPTTRKLPRVIATTLNRGSPSVRSGTSMHKRRSLNKTSAKATAARKAPIVLKTTPSGSECSGDETDRQNDDTYVSFEKFIEPGARSSVLPAAKTNERAAPIKRNRTRIIFQSTVVTPAD